VQEVLTIIWLDDNKNRGRSCAGGADHSFLWSNGNKKGKSCTGGADQSFLWLVSNKKAQKERSVEEVPMIVWLVGQQPKKKDPAQER